VRPGLLPVLGLAVVLLITGVSLSRQGLTERYRMRAQSALALHPDTALREADRAVRLDPAAIGAYYVKAAALARFGEAAAARQVLLDAADREPDRFLTWVLLGDLAVRAGDEAAARRAYGRALELNPRNTDLKRLTADPRSALG
jgi:tetratricopeptide (TPR) repeat protein